MDPLFAYPVEAAPEWEAVREEISTCGSGCCGIRAFAFVTAVTLK
jgi:hypothetical protein